MNFLRRGGMALPTAKIINLHRLENADACLKKLVAQPGFENVRHIRIIADGTPKRRDRECDLLHIERSTCLHNFGDYGYYLFPYKTAAGNWQPGYMEDLLKETLRQETSESCHHECLHNMAADFLMSANNNRGRNDKFTNYNRHLLCTYFAATLSLAGLKLGEAAEAGAFDLGSAKFNDLKDMMSRLIL